MAQIGLSGKPVLGLAKGETRGARRVSHDVERAWPRRKTFPVKWFHVTGERSRVKTVASAGIFGHTKT